MRKRSIGCVYCIALGVVVWGGKPTEAVAVLDPAAERCTISGTPRDDVILGSQDEDVICGMGGDDLVIVGPGDVVRGGDPGHVTVKQLPAVASDAATPPGLIGEPPSPGYRYGHQEETERSLGRLMMSRGLIGPDDLPADLPVSIAVGKPFCESGEAQSPAWDGETALATRYRMVMADYLTAVDPGSMSFYGGPNRVVVKTTLPPGQLRRDLLALLEDQRFDLAVEWLRIEHARMQSAEADALAASWNRQDLIAESADSFRVKIVPLCVEPAQRRANVQRAQVIASELMDRLNATAVEPGVAVSAVHVTVDRHTERVEVEIVGDADVLQGVDIEHELRGDVDVVVSVEDRSMAGSRWNERSAHWGGARIRRGTSGARCTSGFVMSLTQNSYSQRLVSTAGHCYRNQDPILGYVGINGASVYATTQTGSANQRYGNNVLNQIVFGNSQANPSGADVTLIGSGSHKYHRLVWLSEPAIGTDFAFFVTSKSRWLNATSNSTVPVCMNGARTQRNYCGTNLGPRQTRRFDQTFWEQVYSVTPSANTRMCRGGDSGAAVWINTGNALQIVGSFVGGPGGVGDPCRFLAIGEVENELNARVETVLGQATSW